MIDFLANPFDTTGFVPRWHCGAWSPALGWLHIVCETLRTEDGCTLEILKPKKSGLQPPPRGTETILLVDDEDGVRALTRHVLAACGYTVLDVVDGHEALALADTRTGAIDLLITDVVMPGLGGPEVAEQISRRFPGIRVLFVSGYTDDAVIRHGLSEQGVNFLQKPFSPPELAAKVRDVLDASA